jgi:hypothetical protein
VVDDFALTGINSDGQLHSVSERLFRAASNQQGRSHMGGDGRLSVPTPPRALVLATGEEVPARQSIRARQLIVEVGPGEVQRRSKPRAIQVRGNADHYLHEASQAAKPPSGTVYNPYNSGVLAVSACTSIGTMPPTGSTRVTWPGSKASS